MKSDEIFYSHKDWNNIFPFKKSGQINNKNKNKLESALCQHIKGGTWKCNIYKDFFLKIADV